MRIHARISTWILAAGLFALSGASVNAADANGNYGIRGAGTVNCQAYVSATPEQRRYAETWWAGYLTAMNRSTPSTYDLLGKVSTQQATAWLMRYCQQNPQKRFVDAVHALLKAAYPNRQQTGNNQ